MKVKFDEALIRYLILTGSDNDGILARLSNLNFIEDKSKFDFYLERIFEVRRAVCLNVALDLLGQGFSENYVLKEISSISKFLPQPIVDSIIEEALKNASNRKIKSSIKKLELTVKSLSKNGFFIFLDPQKYFTSIKIYGDRTLPAYYDLTITIEKHSDEHRFIITKFLEKLKGKTTRNFTNNLIEALERFGDLYAKLDVLSIVMSYIEEDAVKLSSKGLSKPSIISQLRSKYSDILDHVIKTQSTISPIDRELQRLQTLRKFSNKLIHGSILQISRNRFKIETPKIIQPNFSIEITLISWSKRTRNLILKLLNAIGNKDLIKLQSFLENWIKDK